MAIVQIHSKKPSWRKELYMPMFSVIVPLYNKEQYIKKTVSCVLAQTIADFELIIVDDGSTDNGPQYVSEIQDGRIRMLSQGNAGVSAARNHGIREANGKYICFLDADDTWNVDFLQTVKELFEEFPEAGMVCPSYQVAYGNKVVHPVWKSVDLEKDGYVEDFYEMATASFWICNSSCAAVKREAIQKMERWFPEGETVYEDFDFWIRLGSLCKVAHSNKICATYQRETATNARKTHEHKIVYSISYMRTLDSLFNSDNLTTEQKKWVKEIKDRRMVPFVFSLLLAGEKKKAKQVLKDWKPCNTYEKYKMGLNACCCIPNRGLEIVQSIRMKVF